MEWKHVKPLGESGIAEVETLIGKSLPADYKELVQNYNGGRPTSDNFLVGNSERQFKTLQSLNRDDIETVFKSWELDSQLQGKILPIASDPGGNLLCYNLENFEIVFWWHEDDEIVKVADNLTEFLSMLH